MNILAFIKKAPILTYSVLTFALSWGGILLVIGNSEFSVNGEQSETLFLLMYLAMLAGPSITGIVLTRFIYGREGLHDLATRMFRWRAGVNWYAIALLLAPIAIAVVLLALSLISPDYLPRLITEEDKGFLLQFSLAVGLLVGIFEELGWTGFAVHTLLMRGFGILRTGLIVGVLFGAWNFLVVFLMSDTPAGAGELPLVLFMPATLFTWLPTYRVLMVWVYDRTQSLLLAMLMYASLIAFWRILTPLVIAGLPLVTYYLIFTLVMWFVIGAALRRRNPHQRQYIEP